MTVNITIDLDKKCGECGKGGAVPSGICLSCTAKAFNPNHKMKSPQGKAVQDRMRKTR